MKEKKWKIIFYVGLISFIIPVILGVISAVVGVGIFCITDCTMFYGIEGFLLVIFLYSIVLWPTYILGVFLIAWSKSKIKRIKNDVEAIENINS